jgi:Enoyl-CoA hydratase/isomerase
VPSVTWEWELAGLAGRLALELSADGTPGNPLVPIDLDMWREAGPSAISAAAGLISSALPVTVGMLAGPRSRELQPLLEAVSLTLADGPASPRRPAISRNPLSQAVVATGDLLGEPSLDAAVGRLREAVEHSPRASVACGQLLRQTSALDTTGGLAAEAAAYSLLLGGPEFARWLAARGPAREAVAPASPVLIDRDASRLTVTLNVPSRRNAFSAAMREALLDAVLLAEADSSIKSVELRGAGPAFCSGGDLDEFGTAQDLVGAYLVRLSRAPWRVIDRIAPKVTVHAHGACVGAGTEMLAFAGRVVAAPDAYFQLPEVQMGLVPGAGGSVSVPRRIGRHRAAWLMLTGDRLPAPTALSWGLVDAVS